MKQGKFLLGRHRPVYAPARLTETPEGRLPAVWGQARAILQREPQSCSPDLIVAPSDGDAHKDHQTIGQIVPSVFSDTQHSAHEIPKWDGEPGRPSVYFPLSSVTARRRVELLYKSFPCQRRRDWWDDQVFLGLARLRGVDCRAPCAEAFSCAKSLIRGHPRRGAATSGERPAEAKSRTTKVGSQQ
ncbi:MAG TPA: hypothetical protein VLW50_00075 [Streptosporangiaceae bacterium]|nr:hypothetical protein [Streptosporangiaceae bacterium]